MPNNMRCLPSTCEVQAWRAHPLNAGRKEDLSCGIQFYPTVQSTPKLSLLDCCNHANRRAHACETLVNTQVPVSPPCSDAELLILIYL
jgi:hypothetical protein